MISGQISFPYGIWRELYNLTSVGIQLVLVTDPNKNLYTASLG